MKKDDVLNVSNAYSYQEVIQFGAVMLDETGN